MIAHRTIVGKWSGLAIAMTCFVSAIAIPIAISVNPRRQLARSPTTACGVVVLLFVCLILVCHAWARHADTPMSQRYAVLHPPVVMAWWAMITLAVPGYYAVANPNTIENLLTRVTVDYSFAAWGLLLVLIGSVMVCVGYAISSVFIRPSHWAVNLGRRPIRLRAVGIAYGAILAIQLFKLAITGVAYTADVSFSGPAAFMAWLDYTSGAMPLVLAMMTIGAIRDRWARPPVVWAWLVQFGLALASGFSTPLFNLLLVLGLSSLVAGFRPRRLVLPGLVGLMLAILVVPISEGIRVQSREGRFDGSAGAAPVAILTAFDESWGQGIGVGYAQFRDKMTGRQSESAMVPGIIMAVSPTLIPFAGSEELLAVPAYLVPRALWPGKPIINGGRWISYTYLGHPSTTVSSSAPTLYGHLYIFGGWWTAIFGSLALGALLAFITKQTLAVGLGAVLVGMAPVYIRVGAEYTSMVLTIVQQFIVLVMVYWAITKLSVSARPSFSPSAHRTSVAVRAGHAD